MQFEKQPISNTKLLSYSGHTKTSVFSQWQKHLQQQEYEICCQWLAEIDCSNWQTILWEKIIIFASNADKVEYARQLNHLKIFDVSLIFFDVKTPRNLEI